MAAETGGHVGRKTFFLSGSNVLNFGLTFSLFVSYFTVDIFAQHLRMPRKMLA